MALLQSKRCSDLLSSSPGARAACAALVVLSLAIVCASVWAEVELPALKVNSVEPAIFRGEIAKGLKIEMKLYRDGTSLWGAYLYEVFGREIQVKGTVNEHGEIVLQEFVKGKVTGHFRGRFVSDKRIEGSWYKSSRDKGRRFHLDGTGLSPIRTSSAATLKPAKGQIVSAVAARAVRPAPAQPQPAVKQETAPLTREAPRAPQESNAVAATVRTVAAEEPPGPPIAPKTEVRPVETPAAEGRAAAPVKKGALSGLNFFLNLKVAGAIGGILLLGFGLAWLALVAGSAAGFRDNSALFRKAHARGLSFLPGVFLLALGVGAVLATFVE